jgi:hypothetical protein
MKNGEEVRQDLSDKVPAGENVPGGDDDGDDGDDDDEEDDEVD